MKIPSLIIMFYIIVPRLNSLKPNWFYLIANITNATPDLTIFPHVWCKTPFERWLWNCTSSYEEKCCVFKAAKGRVTSESFIISFIRRKNYLPYRFTKKLSLENSHQQHCYHLKFNYVWNCERLQHWHFLWERIGGDRN